MNKCWDIDRYRTALNTSCILTVKASCCLFHSFFLVISKTYFIKILISYVRSLLSDWHFLHYVHSTALHSLVKVYKMTIKLRSVNTCKLNLIANLKTTCTTHTSSINHNRIHADNCRNSKFLSKKTDEFHHNHRSDCYT